MKVLIVRFSSIGDIILTTPVVRCISQQLGAEVHYLTKMPFKPMLQSNPYIAKVFTIKENLNEVIDVLRGENYTYIIDLHHNLRTRILKWKLRRPVYSFDKLNVEKWLKVNAKIDRLPDIHIVDRYLKTAHRLNVKNDGRGLDYFIPGKERPAIQQYLDKHQIKKYACLSVGAAHNTKCLTTHQIIELCKLIEHPIILLGGKNESVKAKEIIQNCSTHVFNAVDQFSLDQTAACIDQAFIVIAHDTGVMHMGAALKKPMISIWGNTIPKFGMYPYYGSQSIWHKSFQTDGLPCRPCSKIGYDKCPKGHFRCILRISMHSIADTVNDWFRHQ
jgi:ADP-heptose:LPS heptosyltransferase